MPDPDGFTHAIDRARAEKELSRRTFLHRAGLTLLAAAPLGALAGCGGDGGSGSATKKIATAGTPTAPPASGRLDALTFEGFDLEKQAGGWLGEQGVSVKTSYISTTQDVISKFKGGGADGNDLFYSGIPSSQLYVDAGVPFEPLDRNKLPNLANLDPYFAEDKELWTDEAGNRRWLPLDFTVLGITYDAAALSQEPKAWSDLLAPSFKNKLLMLDDPNWNLQLACSILKFEPATLTLDQAAEVEDLLQQFMGQTKSVTTSWGDAATKLASGDATAMFAGYSGLNVFAAAAGKKTITTNIQPEEGSFTCVDGIAINAGSDNKDTAYAYLNEGLTAKVSGPFCVANSVGSPVKGAAKHMNAVTRKLYPYGDLAAVFAAAPLTTDLPVKAEGDGMTAQVWAQRWNELKSRS
jgi:spermidine/putrescine-binding protein